MWRTTPAEPTARTARTITIAFTVVFALLVCRGRPWDLFADAGFSNDFYDEQARSLLRLRLAVRPEVAGMEGFLIDGRTYLYYGPLLALARLPFALFGDLFAGRLTRLSMIIAYATLCTASFHLIHAARRPAPLTAPLTSTSVSDSRHRASPGSRITDRDATTPGSVSDSRHHASRRSRTTGGWRGWGDGDRGDVTRWRVGAFVAAVACSPALYLTGWVSVYHETELWAAAFAAWALVGLLRLAAEPVRRHAVLAALAIAAALLTRAPVGIGMAVGGGLVALMIWRTDRRPALTVLAGCVAGFAAHVVVNVAKFGSPLSLPADQQVLSLTDPTRAAWFAGNNNSFFSLRFLPTTIVHYLRPDTVRFERLVPVVRFGPLATDRGSYPMETITPASSLTTTATLLLGAAIVGVVILAARRAWAPLALTLGGMVAAVPTFTIGFIANRYLVDMLPMLLVPAAFAFAALTLPNATWRRVARAAVLALVAWGTWTNVALALWTQNLKEPGFTEWRYRLDDVIFTDPAPALVSVDPTTSLPVPRDGVVGVSIDPATGACVGVHIAEQGRWVALERTSGALRLSGTVATPAVGTPALVAGGDTWSLVVSTDGVSVVATLIDAGARTEGTPIPLGNGPVYVEIVDDPVVGIFSVTIDGEPALFRFGATTGMIVAGNALTPDGDPGDSLCRQLEARR